MKIREITVHNYRSIKDATFYVADGAQIVATLSRQLKTEFGRGFGRWNLFRMIRFAEVFPDRKIVSALLTQLGWAHFLSNIPLDGELKIGRITRTFT